MSEHYLDLPTFGARLKWARERKRISGDKLAPQLERRGRHTISRWEAGKNEPSLDQITQLAEILGVDRCWLAFGDGEPFALPAVEAFFKSDEGKRVPRKQAETLRLISHSLFSTKSPTKADIREALSLVAYLLRHRAQSEDGDAEGESA